MSLLKILILLFLVSCSLVSEDKRIRLIANNGLSRIDGEELISEPMKEMLDEEQNLHAKGFFKEGAFASDIDPKFIPESNPKFPLPYYLIPIEDAHFLEASLSKDVNDQITEIGSDGEEYFKLFVHPESEEHYNFLKANYKYITQEQTEFMSSPTSSYRSLLVWNRYRQSTPFIAKVSLDRNVIGSIDRLVSGNEVARSLANQDAFDMIGEEAKVVVLAMNKKSGQVEVAGETWKFKCDKQVEEGQSVYVTGHKGLTLLVSLNKQGDH